MAQNVIINGVTYNSVPQVEIPQSGGGTAVFYDTSGGDAEAAHILNGKKAYGANGLVTGSLSVPTISQDGTTKVLSIY